MATPRFAPGTPSWIDVQSPDTYRSASFYEALLGWKVVPTGASVQDGYSMLTLNDQIVAGLGNSAVKDTNATWCMYVDVVDADATAAYCIELGGKVIDEADDVGPEGRRALIEDPLGSPIALWEARDRKGVDLVNAPGAFTWSELASIDLGVSNAFYTSLFGWGLEESTRHHSAFTVDGKVVCGAHTAATGELPGWLVWFHVEDCDEVAARADTLGGSVIVDPGDLDFGRAAVITDTLGAQFGIGQVRADILESTS